MQKDDVQVLFYISKLIYPRHNPFWFIFYMYWSYFKISKRRLVYTLKSAPETLIFNHLKTSPNYVTDVNNTVIVYENNVYRTDKLLKLVCRKSKKFRNVYVIPSPACDKDVIIVSDTCYFNMENCGILDAVQLLDSHVSSVAFADEVDVSLINSPHDINNAVIDSVLRGYFSTPKLLNKCDIIEVNVKNFAKDLFFLNCKVNNVDSIYLKCNKILVNNIEVEGSYFCVIGKTAIKQSVDIQSFLPSKKNKVVENDTLEESRSVWIPLCPYGLQPYLDSIEKALKPFIELRKLNLAPAFLLQGEKGCGKEILLSSLALRLGMHYYKVNNSDLVANVYAQNETKIRNVIFNAKMAAPCIVSIHNFESFGKNNEGQHDERIMGYFADELHTLFENNIFPVILFGSTNEKDIPTDLKKLFLETFEINALDSLQREYNLKWILESEGAKYTVNLSEISNRSHGFLFEDLKTLVYYAESNGNCADFDDNAPSNETFFSAIDFMQSNYNESIGAPKVPKVQWEDVGGLNDVKEEITKTINLPLKYPELLKSSGLKRSGILLFGPPGTGKTLIAKAVATECNLCFLSVKGPELLNMYVGQSEQNIREVFERARQASPCIIFFDELDSLAPNRGISGDSGGVMDRVVSQLLAEMDGLNDSATVFIIGATNRPDLIDPALLRPGRFDKLLYVGPCTDEKSKLSVLKALSRKFNLGTEVDLAEIVRMCPPNITGADFYGICSNAWSSAVGKLIASINKGELDAEEVSQEDVLVNFEDFQSAIETVKPSISPADLLYFETLKRELGSNS